MSIHRDESWEYSWNEYSWDESWEYSWNDSCGENDDRVFME